MNQHISTMNQHVSTLNPHLSTMNQHPSSIINQHSPTLNQISTMNQHLSATNQHVSASNQHISPLNQFAPTINQYPMNQQHVPAVNQFVSTPNANMNQHGSIMNQYASQMNHMDQHLLLLTMNPSPNHHLPLVNSHSSPIRSKSINYDPRRSVSEHNGYIQDYYNNQQFVNNDDSYESELVTAGLGGYWVKNDNNESVWIPTHSPLSTPWPRDKRFGSLDRRKEKFVHTKHHETRKNVLVNQQEPPIMQQRDNIKPLVRTQSLGSVGAQTVDVLYPDDASSYDSDGQSYKERSYSRKSKPKGWCETSLDTPDSGRDDQLQASSRMSFTSPQTPKLLEIPAESNPSPIVSDTANNDIFNSNNLMDLPKNCTVVQAGQFKPYREVTKPFEMEDFYKYSTKFREKKTSESSCKQNDGQETEKNKGKDTESTDSDGQVVQKSIYQPLQPMKCQPYGPPK